MEVISDRYVAKVMNSSSHKIEAQSFTPIQETVVYLAISSVYLMRTVKQPCSLI